MAIDTFFLGCCLHISVFFEILKESFAGPRNVFIENHQSILNLVADLETFYKPIIFVQFFTCSFRLCVIIFHAMFTDESAIKHFIIIFMNVLQLFVFCYGGQIVMDKSRAVGEDMYDLDKDLLIIIARTQKGSKIKSGIYEANFHLLNLILNSALSLMMVLRTFVSK